jgi:predicted O-methyltransferase YrrM
MIDETSRLTYFTKAFQLTGAAAAVWLKAVTRHNGDSRRVRTDLKNVRFRSRAKIPEERFADFCRRLPNGDDARPESLQVPLAFLESGLGGAAYYLTLASVAACRQPRQVVEFGTFLGHSALVFAMNASHAQILTIDLPDEVEDLSNLNSTDQSHALSSRERVGLCYRDTIYANRITELKCDSRKLELASKLDSADLIFIDGGHDATCIAADTENAWSVARPGTVILWDDYFWLYPDVVEYLERLAQKRELVRITETNLVACICN